MRLFRIVILRHLLTERLRAATTVVGIALGLAVIVAVRLTNASSVRGFAAALELVSGRTSLEIVGASGPFDELRLRGLEWLRDYGDVAPIIDGEVVALTPEGGSERLHLLGVDILREPPFREYKLSGSEVASGTRKFLELLVDPHAIILTEQFGRAHGLHVGDTVRLVTGDTVREFTVRGLLSDEGPARLLEGHFALMDIAAAQLALQRLGQLDRVDLRVSGNVDVQGARMAIAKRLPPGLLVQRPAERTEQVERMLQAFHLNLEALSYIALLVGLFLIYNAASVSVISRREEIGMLRALGVTRRGVSALFLGEAALLGSLGCVVGVVGGRLLANVAIHLTAATVQTLYVAVAAAAPQLTMSEITFACAVGLPLAIVAGVIPALEASAIPPVAAIQVRLKPDTTVAAALSVVSAFRRTSASPVTSHRGRLGSLVVPAVLLSLAWWLARQPAIDGRPIFGWGAAVLTVLGAACVVPGVLRGFTRIVTALLQRWFLLDGWLANANLSAGIRRIGISVAALAMSLSMMVAIAVMIGSFRETVQYWVGQTLKADLYVSASTRPSRQSDFTISPEVENAIRQHPSAAAVEGFRREDARFEGATITLAAGDYNVVLRYGNLLFKAPADARAAMQHVIDENAAVVSEPFAIRHHRNVGDRIQLMTPDGPVSFRIAAVYYDYSADRGIVVLDRRTFARYFGERRPTSLQVYLRPGHSPDAVRADILALLGERHRVFIQTNATLRREVLRIFDSTFAITYALEGVAIVVAMMGVATTLLTLILDRRREIAVLRLIGTARGQIEGMIVIEALMIGAVSQAIGIVVGMALSLILIFVINVQSFGWTIQWHTPWMFLVQSSGLILVATMLAGFVPARRAARIEFVEQLVEA